jgi:septum formation protein
MNTGATFWLGDEPLLLASGSATRREMLRAAGIPLEIAKADIDERAVERPLVEEGASPVQIALALACAKALAVSAAHPGRVVLGADQTLACAGTAFHKPADPAAARAQIAALSGRSHNLHSAFVLARDGSLIGKGTATARLTMRRLSEEFIATYVDAMGDAALGSVGAYQIEGLGAQLFESVEGDHFTILGLPLFAVLAALRAQGLLRT